MKGWFQVTLVLLVFGLIGCGDDCEEGEGARVEIERNFQNFSTFSLDIPGSVEIFPDTNLESSKVVLFGQKNVINGIEMKVSEGTLSASFTSCFKNHEEIEFRIYTPWIQKIIVNSSARVKSNSAIFGDHVALEANAGSSINLGLKVDTFTTLSRNAVDITVTGYAKKQFITSSSSGRYFGSELLSDSVVVGMFSSGYANIYSTGYLVADVQAGIVEFNGEDTLNVSTNIGGSGQVFDLR